MEKKDLTMNKNGKKNSFKKENFENKINSIIQNAKNTVTRELKNLATRKSSENILKD